MICPNSQLPPLEDWKNFPHYPQPCSQASQQASEASLSSIPSLIVLIEETLADSMLIAQNEHLEGSLELVTSIGQPPGRLSP